MTWMLYELARHPEYQSKMREEVRAIRARVAERGDSDFSVSDLDAMPHVLAAMKEVLRLHPIVYGLIREASRDDVLPLSTPVTTTTGEVVDEIPIPKGTTCQISVWAYNRYVLAMVSPVGRQLTRECVAIRLPSIWGPDADEFNPTRWIEHEKMGQTYVGVTSNLMTFSAGLQACIGWRFSCVALLCICALCVADGVAFFQHHRDAGHPRRAHRAVRVHDPGRQAHDYQLPRGPYRAASEGRHEGGPADATDGLACPVEQHFVLSSFRIGALGLARREPGYSRSFCCSLMFLGQSYCMIYTNL